MRLFIWSKLESLDWTLIPKQAPVTSFWSLLNANLADARCSRRVTSLTEVWGALPWQCCATCWKSWTTLMKAHSTQILTALSRCHFCYIFGKSWAALLIGHSTKVLVVIDIVLSCYHFFYDFKRVVRIHERRTLIFLCLSAKPSIVDALALIWLSSWPEELCLRQLWRVLRLWLFQLKEPLSLEVNFFKLLSSLDSLLLGEDWLDNFLSAFDSLNHDTILKTTANSL